MMMNGWTIGTIAAPACSTKVHIPPLMDAFTGKLRWSKLICPNGMVELHLALLSLLLNCRDLEQVLAEHHLVVKVE